MRLVNLEDDHIRRLAVVAIVVVVVGVVVGVADVDGVAVFEVVGVDIGRGQFGIFRAGGRLVPTLRSSF